MYNMEVVISGQSYTTRFISCSRNKEEKLTEHDACNLYDIINRDFLYSKSLEKHNGI